MDHQQHVDVIIKQDIARLKYLFLAETIKIKLHTLCLRAGFNPDQPRVPTGHSTGGQWTDADGPFGRPLLDLREFENGRGHTIARHVGKNAEYLKRRIRTSPKRLGTVTTYIPFAGSFSSLEAANKLVRATLSDSKNKVLLDKIANGEIVDSFPLDKTFPTPTGIEAYVPKANRPKAFTFRRKLPLLKPKVRKTYSVRVVVIHDPNMPRGYQIITAFPRNKTNG